MTQLQPPDSHHFDAAQGWVELGNYVEAQAELEELTHQALDHPAVMEMRWEIYGRAGCWDDALEIAEALVHEFPEDVRHWIWRSTAFHKLKATADARDLLQPAVTRFPYNADIRLNLACYECQLGNLIEARRWLAESFALTQSKKANLEALDHPDLAPLWTNTGAT